MKNKLKYYILYILIPLIIGTGIYVTSNTRTYLSDLIRDIISLPIVSYPYIIRNYACDCCWSIALFSTIHKIYSDQQNGILISTIISLLFSSVMEALQKVPSFPGTFDIWDIAMESLVIVTISVFLLHQKEVHYEKKMAC